MPHDPLAAFAATFGALYAAHMVGDHWIQTGPQAMTKGGTGWLARLANARHVAALTAVKLAALALAHICVGLPLTGWLVLALAVDAASHYWADRRSTLLSLVRLMDRIHPGYGKEGFALLGAPRTGHDDNPSLGTGLYALDQSWHIGWLFVAALIAAR